MSPSLSSQNHDSNTPYSTSRPVFEQTPTASTSAAQPLSAQPLSARNVAVRSVFAPRLTLSCLAALCLTVVACTDEGGISRISSTAGNSDDAGSEESPRSGSRGDDDEGSAGGPNDGADDDTDGDGSGDDSPSDDDVADDSAGDDTSDDDVVVDDDDIAPGPGDDTADDVPSPADDDDDTPPTECPAPRRMCDGVCTEVLDNPVHCGFCGIACAPGNTCVNGICEGCPEDQIDCRGQCIEVMSNHSDCGACGAECGVEQSCVEGRCTCPAPFTPCGLSCVDLTTDAAHCGVCGMACTVGQSCLSGVCTCTAELCCPAGLVDCDGECAVSCAGQGGSGNGGAGNGGAAGSGASTSGGTSQGGTGGVPMGGPFIVADEDGWVAPGSNDFGIFGAWFLYADEETAQHLLLPSEISVCSRAINAALGDEGTQWGSGFGLTLADGAAWDGSDYTGFSFTLSSNTPEVQVNVRMLGIDPPHQHVVTDGATVEVRWSSLIQPDWAPELTPFDPSSLDQIQFQVAAIPDTSVQYQVCISNFTVLP